jgi:hypothetical protein
MKEISIGFPIGDLLEIIWSNFNNDNLLSSLLLMLLLFCFMQISTSLETDC